MKYCGCCETEKPIEKFSKRTLKSGKATAYHWCKECSNKKSKENYVANIEKRKAKNRATSKNNNKDNRIRIINYLIEHGCIDCGEKDPIVLEFDHQRDKKFTISKRIGNAWNGLKLEIDKCEVRCANCHRRKTAKSRKWYSYIAYDENGKAYRIK